MPDDLSGDFKQKANDLRAQAKEILEQAENLEKKAMEQDVAEIEQASKAIIETTKKWLADFSMRTDEIYELAGFGGAAEFSKYFEHNVGMTPTSYRNDLRIKKAKELFPNLDLSLEDISKEIGYANLGGLRMLFTRHLSITLSEKNRDEVVAKWKAEEKDVSEKQPANEGLSSDSLKGTDKGGPLF